MSAAEETAPIPSVDGLTRGQRLRLTRLDKGWTREDLAKAAGYKATSTIQRYERDEIEWPHDDVVLAFARALRVTPTYLMTGRRYERA